MPNNDCITLFPAGSTTGTSEAVPINNVETVGGSVVASDATVSAGSVVYETAPTKNYAGTWAQAFAITPVRNTNVTAAASVAANFIRARFATNLSGGATAAVYLNRVRKA